MPFSLPVSRHPDRRRRHWLACGALALAAGSASAQVFKDNALNALYTGERLAEMDQLAQKRLAARADDAQAVLAAALLAMLSNDAGRREAVIQRAETCVQQAPQAAPCHYALGSVLGIHAMSQGVMKIISSVGRVKTELARAVELEPQWYTGRSGMVEFYLRAPDIAGGSTRKAAEVARAAPRPDQAAALEARVALKEERYGDAVGLLGSIKPGGDPAVAEDVQQLWISTGVGLLGKGQREQARALFERLIKEQPELATGPYGLARVETDAGAYAEAVALLERSAQLKGAERLPVDYRLGLALQGLGRNEAARAAYQRFIAGGRGSRNALEDARKRLTQLG